MKEQELRERATCGVCRKRIGHTGLPMFWTLKIERHGLKADAMRRQDGLAAILGNSVLASVMGPHEEMTTPLMDKPVTVTVCESCAVERVCIAQIAEEHGKNDDEDEEI